MNKRIKSVARWIIMTILVLWLASMTVGLLVAQGQVNELKTSTDMQNTRISEQKSATLVTALGVSVLANTTFINTANLYSLGADNTCEDIKVRLQDLGEVLAISELTDLNDVANEDAVNNALKLTTQALIEKNKDSEALVKDLEHIEYCLTK